jgi:hypothetical protein
LAGTIGPGPGDDDGGIFVAAPVQCLGPFKRRPVLALLHGFETAGLVAPVRAQQFEGEAQGRMEELRMPVGFLTHHRADDFEHPPVVRRLHIEGDSIDGRVARWFA